MLLFLLPLLFNPFSLIVKWIPAIYLAAWPIIIQTLGRETLVTHALVLIMFILTCDISRQMMLKTIGFDLMSFPLGIGLLLALTTSKGALFLSMIQPVFSGLLVVVEPLFLLIEIYLFMDMIRSFNRWISAKANERDEDSGDLSSWEPPLSRGAVIARITVILITISSYIGAYMLIQESKSLLEIGSQVPVNFTYAIAALVTLQLIAFSATVYKEEGVLSETALVALLAAVPIFIASWSYYHLIVTANSESRPWSSYFPFSIFSGSSTSSDDNLGQLVGESEDFSFSSSSSSPLLSGAKDPFQSGKLNFGSNYHHIDIGPLEKAVNQLDALDYGSKQLLLTLARRLIMVINSILGLSLDKLAKYYFGPDFWYILAGRFVCLFWWAMVSLKRRNGADEEDNNEREQVNQLGSGGSKPEAASGSCCGSSSSAGERAPTSGQQQQQLDHLGSDLTHWFGCMWDSAKACSSSSSTGSGGEGGGSRAARYYRWLLDNLMNFSRSIYKLLINYFTFDLTSIYYIWLARWRSNIVQRLCQSMLVQVYYITQVMFVYE